MAHEPAEISSELLATYEKYRLLRRSTVCIADLKEKANALVLLVEETVHPILEISLVVSEAYQQYANSSIKRHLLVKYYGTKGGNDEALEIVYDILEEVEILISTGGLSEAHKGRITDHIYEALLSLKGSVCALCSSTDDESKVTTSAAAKHRASVQVNWKRFLDALGEHPTMKMYIRNCSDPIGRAIESIDNHLYLAIAPLHLSEDTFKGFAPPSSLLPPQTTAPPGGCALLHRQRDLMKLVKVFQSKPQNRALLHCPTRSAEAAAIDGALPVPIAKADSATSTASGASGESREPNRRKVLCGTYVLGVICGLQGTGKTSLAITAAQELMVCSSAQYTNKSPLSCRYDFIRWMPATGGGSESWYSEWVALASDLGVFDVISGSSGKWGSCRPPVSLAELIQSVAYATSSMDYLLIFDDVRSYDSIRECLSDFSLLGTKGGGGHAHHILVTTTSPGCEWRPSQPAVVVETSNFNEAQCSELVALRRQGAGDTANPDILLGVARALYRVTAGNALGISSALCAIEHRHNDQECKIIDTAEKFAAHVYRARGDLGTHVRAEDTASSISCCLPFWRKSRACADKAEEREGDEERTAEWGTEMMGAVSTGWTRKYAALSTTGHTNELVVMVAARWLANSLNDKTRFLPFSRKVLGFVALIPPTGIPRALLEELYTMSSSDEATGSPEEFEKTLKPLMDSGILLSENESSTRFMVHRDLYCCLGEIIIGQKLPSSRGSFSSASESILFTRFALSKFLRDWVEPMVNALNKIFIASAGRRDLLAAWGGHVMALLGCLDSVSISGMEQSGSDVGEYGLMLSVKCVLCLRLSESYGAQGRHLEGLQMLKKRCLLLRSAPVSRRSMQTGSDNGVAATLYQLALFYGSENRLREALVMHAEAVQCFDIKYEGSDQLDFGRALLGYARACKSLNKTLMAIHVQKRLLDWQRGNAHIGDCHLDVSLTLSAIGSLYMALADYDNARKYYHESLEIEKKLFDMSLLDEADLVKSLNNTGNVYYRMGCLAEALTFYLDSLERSRRLYTSEHDDVARTLYNCGNVQFLLKDLDRSLLSFQEALRILYALHGQSSIEAAKVLNNIGNVLMSQEKFRRAAETYASSLAIKKIHFSGGDYHPDLAHTMTNLASAYISLGEGAEALCVYKECLACARQSLPADDPKIARLLELISQLERLEERRGMILKLFGQYLNDRSKQRKTALGFSKQDKLNAALFVIEFVEGPLFITLHHIRTLPSYEKHAAPLTHGSLGELFNKCCEI